MTDRLMMMRLMGCKFGIKKTEHSYREERDHPAMLNETRYEVTVAGPSGMKFKAVMVVTDPGNPALGDPITSVSGNFVDNGGLVREIVEMIENDEFKPNELIDHTKICPQNQVVFVLDTGESKTFPPCGIRIMVCESFQELTQDMIEFFVHSEGLDNVFAQQLVRAHQKGDMKLLKSLMPHLAGKRKWSISDQVWGYDYLNQTD